MVSKAVMLETARYELPRRVKEGHPSMGLLE